MLSLSLTRLFCSQVHHTTSHHVSHHLSHHQHHHQPVAAVAKELFRFGLISDIQYCDSDDGKNFHGSQTRYYRNSLATFRNSIAHWNQMHQTHPLVGAVVMGDMIDGKAGTLKQQENCLHDFQAVANQAKFGSLFYCFGNHCHYCFSREQLYKHFVEPNSHHHHQQEHHHHSHHEQNQHHVSGKKKPLYFDWSPCPKWRMIFVDSYDISLIGASTIENRALSEKWLSEHNPNDLNKGESWFNNLPRNKRRWVPYNGGVSDLQLQWLDNTLKRAKQNDERVIVCSHQPIWAPDRPQSMIWNSEEILSIVHQHGNVCLWLAGHDHKGQYDVDGQGIHHLIVPAPIEAKVGDATFGHVEVHSDKIRLRWNGDIPTNTLKPFPTDMLLP